MYFYFIKIVLLVKMCCGKFSGGVENTIQHLIIRTLFTNHMLYITFHALTKTRMKKFNLLMALMMVFALSFAACNDEERISPPPRWW